MPEPNPLKIVPAGPRPVPAESTPMEALGVLARP
jgi:hypothetical protein